MGLPSAMYSMILFIVDLPFMSLARWDSQARPLLTVCLRAATEIGSVIPAINAGRQERPTARDGWLATMEHRHPTGTPPSFFPVTVHRVE